MNQPALTPADFERLYNVAKNQRAIMFCILAQIAVSAIGFGLSLPALVENLLTLVVGIASIVFTVLLARLVFSIVGVVICVLFLLVPFAAIVQPDAAVFLRLVPLLTLLVVNQRATKTLKAAGFHVGLMGGDPDEVRNHQQIAAR